MRADALIVTVTVTVTLALALTPTLTPTLALALTLLKAWEQTPLAKLFTLEDEWSMLKLRAQVWP